MNCSDLKCTHDEGNCGAGQMLVPHQQKLVAGALSVAWSLRKMMKYVYWTATTATTQTALHSGSSIARYAQHNACRAVMLK